MNASSTFVVTGSASGIGAAVAARLRGGGHTVIGVDLHDADVVADLAAQSGRRAAIDGVLALCGGHLDGAVMVAGVGPGAGAEDQIATVNVLGVTDLLSGWRDALCADGGGKVVVFGSNSSTTTPFVPESAVRRLVRGEVDAAVAQIRRRKGLSAAIAYAASKLAVTRWARTQAASPAWAGCGVRINVVTPGPVLTPMLRAQLDGPEGRRVRAFPVPVGGFGDPEQFAAVVEFLLSPEADFIAGAVLTVDGGTEALLRDDWPRRLPVTKLPRLLMSMRSRRSSRGLLVGSSSA
ncbi:SDR family oxidoreductase [Gordonia otitidis]|uniref:Oxidoreductase n=1 Tax=Gordonia otitidis (strain DSM 44809 / CCUG 52243 / JCM 12355 / NBRC 100426 / IFM 10032) TaxID=1108044 RepID=H5TNA1_GORO1|nr:SDR family oxidoreductase [Gordonia otitidis]UEA60348.1 SDR family oxidoreductase [Gordonia otitidis]GAB34959.1 putative oxidoreductase [Gordonia otitidis NBRC 100426]